MTDVKTDIDIDFSNRDIALDDLTCIMATETRQGERRRHLSGVYFHDIPVDPLDGLAVWDYQEAEQRGYFKIDFLNNTIYREVRDEAHLVALLNTEPPWEVFDDPEIVAELAHIANYFDVIQMIRPRSIDDLAVCIAIVRPGKVYLIGRPRSQIDREIWAKTEKYHFKRSHAYSYAAAIVVQLNLMVEKACENF